MVDRTEREAGKELDPVLLGIDCLYLYVHVPIPAQSPGFPMEQLPGRGFPLRHDALRAHIPPLIIERWLVEEFPDILYRGCDRCGRACRDSHTFPPFRLEEPDPILL